LIILVIGILAYRKFKKFDTTFSNSSVNEGLWYIGGLGGICLGILFSLMGIYHTLYVFLAPKAYIIDKFLSNN